MPDVPSFRPGVPRHEQLSEWLRDAIMSGQFKPHARIPSEHDLGEQFGVSRITVRRALQTLENEQLIYRRQGLGSFAAPPKLPQGLVRLTDFAQDMERAGLVASSRVIHHRPEPADAVVASALGLEQGATVVRLDRIRLGDGQPVALDRTWMGVYYGQLLADHDLTKDTIYRILEREYQVPVLRGIYRVEAVAATPDEAMPLEIADGSALLLVQRTSLTVEDRAVYFQKRYYRADRVAFHLEVARDIGASGSHPVAGMPLREFEPVFKAPDSHD